MQCLNISLKKLESLIRTMQFLIETLPLAIRIRNAAQIVIKEISKCIKSSSSALQSYFFIFRQPSPAIAALFLLDVFGFFKVHCFRCSLSAKEWVQSKQTATGKQTNK